MTIKQKPIKYGLGIDWETSGADWGFRYDDYSKQSSYQGISFGAVVFETETFEPVETLYREIHFDANKYQWTEQAEAIHGLSRTHLLRNGVPSEEAACDLAELVLKYWGPNPFVVMLAHRLDFDLHYTKQLLEPYELMFNRDGVKLDTCGTAFALLGIHKSDKLFDFLGLEGRGKHNALEDILMTLEAMRTMRLIMREALGL